MKNLYLFFCLLSLTGIFHACSFSTCEDAYEVRLENHSNNTEYAVVIDGKIADKIILPASTISGEYPHEIITLPSGEHQVDFYENASTLSEVLCSSTVDIKICETEVKVLSCAEDAGDSFSGFITAGLWYVKEWRTDNDFDGVYEEVIQNDPCNTCLYQFAPDGKLYILYVPECVGYSDILHVGNYIAGCNGTDCTILMQDEFGCGIYSVSAVTEITPDSFVARELEFNNQYLFAKYE